jgi:ABC-type sugar transport system ATPase subunit
MRVVTAADTLGVRSLLKRSVEDLSGGERQRILLARALVKDADIYLFDEPLSNLDPQMRLQARQEMMLVHRIKQKPTVYVTHDQAEALAIAHRVAIIVKGQKLQEGTPDEIYHRPKNLFIAQLVGTPQINILDAQIFHTDTRYSVLGDGIYFTLPPHWNSILNTSRLTNIKLGIRPNSIIPEWDFNTLNPTSYIPTYAQITQVITRINDTVVSLRLGSTTELLALFETKKDLFLEVGQIVNIGIHREQIFLFDSKTEELLNPPDKP